MVEFPNKVNQVSRLADSELAEIVTEVEHVVKLFVNFGNNLKIILNTKKSLEHEKNSLEPKLETYELWRRQGKSLSKKDYGIKRKIVNRIKEIDREIMGLNMKAEEISKSIERILIHSEKNIERFEKVARKETKFERGERKELERIVRAGVSMPFSS